MTNPGTYNYEKCLLFRMNFLILDHCEAGARLLSGGQAFQKRGSEYYILGKLFTNNVMNDNVPRLTEW